MRFIIVLVIALLATEIAGQISFGKSITATSIDEALVQPLRIKHLDLSGTNLIKLPLDLVALKNLRTLDLSDNELSHLDPHILSQLPNLEGINLHNNFFNKFPEALVQCGSLVEINLGMNKIEVIPETINKLKFLETIKLHQNNLQKIEQPFGLKYLKLIRLDGNNLSHLAVDLFADCNRLKYCNLNGNKLNEIPLSLQKCKLRTLDIGNNKFTSLAGIENLKHLKKLILDWNKINSDDLVKICSIKKLEILSIERCELSNFEDCFYSLNNLKLLSLMHNKLSEFPKELLNNKKLQKIWLKGNPMIIDRTIETTSVEVVF